jgi:hypothetical protein
MTHQTNENHHRHSLLEYPEAGWAVYKTVFQNGVSHLEKVESEQPFSSRENCQKLVDELNQKRVDEFNRAQNGVPDDPCYLCGREDLRSPIRCSTRFRDS